MKGKGKELMSCRHRNITDLETLKNEHVPLIQLHPQLLCFSIHKNINVAPHSLSLQDSARRCPRHSHGPFLTPWILNNGKKKKKANKKCPRERHKNHSKASSSDLSNFLPDKHITLGRQCSKQSPVTSISKYIKTWHLQPDVSSLKALIRFY